MPRECCKYQCIVEKRGRGRGFFGWVSGHPWAERRLELNITYTSAHLEYYKGEDQLRDRIDLMGSSTIALPDGTPIIGQRQNCVEITLASSEKLYLSCQSDMSHTKILNALKYAGDPITMIDSLAERLQLNVLMKDHERAIYEYIEFKGTKLPGALEQTFNPSTPGVITLDQLNEWESILENTFPKLYTKNSDAAQMEEYQSSEFNRKMEMHNMEAANARKSFADEDLVKKRLHGQTFQDKVVYVMEKEHRMLEQIKELVSKYAY